MWRVNLSPFPDSLSISWFSLHFLILSPFPLHFLILSSFSRSPAATRCATLGFNKCARQEMAILVSGYPSSQRMTSVQCLASMTSFWQKVPIVPKSLQRRQILWGTKILAVFTFFIQRAELYCNDTAALQYIGCHHNIFIFGNIKKYIHFIWKYQTISLFGIIKHYLFIWHYKAIH